MMYFYEIRNKITQATAEATAKNFKQACKLAGWKVRDCKCVWRASCEF